MYDSDEIVSGHVQFDKTPDGNVSFEVTQGSKKITLVFPPNDAKRIGEALIRQAEETDIVDKTGLTMAELEEAMQRKFDSSAFRVAAEALPPSVPPSTAASDAIDGLTADDQAGGS